MKGRKGFVILLLFAILGSCQNNTSTTAPVPTSSKPSTANPTDSPTPGSVRKAIISEVFDDVKTRVRISDDYQPAMAGVELPVGGQALTGEPGKAKLDLVPDNTIVRLGPRTEFTLQELNHEPQSFFSKLKLAMGQLWIILRGGEMQIETDIGVASVRGSFMGVVFDPEKRIMTAVCLEGVCSLSNDLGTTNLTSTQSSDIIGENNAPSSARPLSEDEYRKWQENNPEAAGLPAPEVFGIPPLASQPIIDPAVAWPTGQATFQVVYPDPVGDTVTCSNEKTTSQPSADIVSTQVSDMGNGFMAVDVMIDEYSVSQYYVYVTFYWLSEPASFADYLAEITPGGVKLVKQNIPGNEIEFASGETFVTGKNEAGKRVFRFEVEKKAEAVSSLVVSLYENLPDNQVCDHQEISIH
jgi:hypothetical protein